MFQARLALFGPVPDAVPAHGADRLAGLDDLDDQRPVALIAERALRERRSLRRRRSPEVVELAERLRRLPGVEEVGVVDGGVAQADPGLRHRHATLPERHRRAQRGRPASDSGRSPSRPRGEGRRRLRPRPGRPAPAHRGRTPGRQPSSDHRTRAPPGPRTGSTGRTSRRAGRCRPTTIASAAATRVGSMPRTSSIDAWQSSAEILPQEVRGAAGTVGPADGAGGLGRLGRDRRCGLGGPAPAWSAAPAGRLRARRRSGRRRSPSAATRHGRRLTT